MANTNHSFDSWTKKLMDTPPLIDSWQKEQVGEKNEGPYRSGYEKIEIKDNQEELVNLSSFGISNSEYYIDKFFDYLDSGNQTLITLLENKVIWPFIWTRKSIAQKLQTADGLLRKHDLFLRVISGWRHPALQEIIKQQAQKKLSREEIEKLFATQTGLTPHTSGGALDIQLWSLQNNKNLNQTGQNDEYGFYNLELKQNPTPEEETKKKIRRILYHILCTPDVCFSKEDVFTIHPGEFWHFGYGDPLSSYLNQLPFAKFGETYPPKDFRITKFS